MASSTKASARAAMVGVCALVAVGCGRSPMEAVVADIARNGAEHIDELLTGLDTEGPALPASDRWLPGRRMTVGP